MGTLGGPESYAISINNSNILVGGSFLDPDYAEYHAFIVVSNAMVDLNSLVDDSGSGWVLTEARAINDAGQIAGLGTYGGASHIFLLNPLPSITAIALSGTNVLVRFSTLLDRTYSLVSRENVAAGAWSPAVTNLVGNGSIVTATNLGGLLQPQRFYRARLDNP